jgi:pyruvate formate-lyase activating enzyme-like uncharacterized protein
VQLARPLVGILVILHLIRKSTTKNLEIPQLFTISVELNFIMSYSLCFLGKKLSAVTTCVQPDSCCYCWEKGRMA